MINLTNMTDEELAAKIKVDRKFYGRKKWNKKQIKAMEKMNLPPFELNKIKDEYSK